MNSGDEGTPICEWSDEKLDAEYSLKIKKLSGRHWTPIGVAKRVADYLVEGPGTKVLDIGSGAGKFCLIAAAYSNGYFAGVEQHESLVKASRKLAKRHQIEKVKFIHANIQNIKFSDYEAFYFFNSFGENLDPTDNIDKDCQVNAALFEVYSQYLYEQLLAAPIGTKIATYCTEAIGFPDGYILIKTGTKGKLKFWQKRT